MKPTIKITRKNKEFCISTGGGVHLNDRCILDSNGVLGAYPIGSIYLSVNNTSPASLFGGTWEKIQDRFLLASGSYALGAEGGSTSHNHTLNNGFAEIGYSWANGLNYTLHANIIQRDYQADLRTAQDTAYEDGATWGQSRATALGGTTDNTETLPPYLVVNVWKRIA